MLGPLLERILSQSRLGLDQACVHFLKLVSGVIDFLSKHVVLLLQLLVLITLLWVKIVQARLILEVDVLDLLLVALNL